MRSTISKMALAVFFIFGCNAFADPITLTWTDTITHWTGWGGNAGWTYSGNEDMYDVIGEPQISGGTVVTENGYLSKITFDYLSSPGWMNFTDDGRSGEMLPGDLFLDVNSDGYWDYIVSFYNGNSNALTDGGRYYNQSPFSHAPVYSINLPIDGPAQDADHSFGYLVTGADNTGWWSGYDIRNNHPFAVTGITGDPLGFASLAFSGLDPMNGSPLVFDLEGLNIPGNALSFGFAPNCANEVIMAKVHTPEPSTIVLLGSGLIAAVVFARKRRTRQAM